MAKRVQQSVVAEGVETQQHYNFAKNLGCDVAQGYYIALPMPIENILVWLKHWQGKIT